MLLDPFNCKGFENGPVRNCVRFAHWNYWWSATVSHGDKEDTIVLTTTSRLFLDTRSKIRQSSSITISSSPLFLDQTVGCGTQKYRTVALFFQKFLCVERRGRKFKGIRFGSWSDAERVTLNRSLSTILEDQSREILSDLTRRKEILMYPFVVRLASGV